MFKLRFPEAEIAMWAERYSYTENDMEFVEVVRPAALVRGYLERDEFLSICEWKTQRSKPLCARNDEHTLRIITRAAFGTADEPLKMDLLRILDGVEWPTASTILHFGDPRPYPMLDYRALWSLGYAKPPRYTMEFGLRYLEYTRTLAIRLRLPIRTVDQALWQYSKERQPRM